MAKRKINPLLGKSAGKMGLDHFTTGMLGFSLTGGAVAYFITKDFFIGTATIVSLSGLFYLITGGKPGRFWNDLMGERPHWVRSYRAYINTWSHEYQPEKKLIQFNQRSFIFWGAIYAVVAYFWKPFAMLGLVLFILPFFSLKSILRR